MTVESCRCDRCSLIFQKGGMTYALGDIRRDKGHEMHTYGHLCPLCAEEILAWMKGYA